MVFIFKKRTGSYASFVIMLSEFNGSQCVDIISTDGKDDFFLVGTEDQLAKARADKLKELGFMEMDE